MALTEAEKQQVEAAVDAFLESPNVQTTFTNLVTTAEGGAEKAIDTIIANANNTVKGIASFDVNDFIVAAGVVSINIVDGGAY